MIGACDTAQPKPERFSQNAPSAIGAQTARIVRKAGLDSEGRRYVALDGEQKDQEAMKRLDL